MEQKETAKTGTTLGVLALYLEHGINCRIVAGSYQGPQPRRLVGLETHKVFPVRLQDGPGPAISITYEECLPELFAFPDLCTSLEDGTVPAVEVAKLALFVPDYLDQQVFDWDKVAYGVDDDDQGQECLSVLVPDGQTIPYRGDPSIVYLWANGDVHVHNGPHSNQIGITTYLRSKHIAVGLTPEQYIRKEVRRA